MNAVSVGNLKQFVDECNLLNNQVTVAIRKLAAQLLNIGSEQLHLKSNLKLLREIHCYLLISILNTGQYLFKLLVFILVQTLIFEKYLLIVLIENFIVL